MAKFDKELQSYISQIELDKTDIKTFLKLMGQAQASFAQTLDCLQATRPFYADLFKALLKNYHLGWTEFMKSFWNKRLLEFDVFTIITQGCSNTGVSELLLCAGKTNNRLRYV